MKKLLVILIGFLTLSCEMPTDFSLEIDDNSGEETTEEETTEEETDSLYPTIVWNNEPMGSVSGNISASAVTSAPSNNSFFDYRGLTFTATHGAESGEFSLTDATISMMDMDNDEGDMINILAGELSSISFFHGHTVKVIMLWEDVNGNYFEYEVLNDTMSETWSFTSILTNDISAPNVASNGSDGYLIAFKEIRFIADDGVNYYTWTNPDL